MLPEVSQTRSVLKRAPGSRREGPHGAQGPGFHVPCILWRCFSAILEPMHNSAQGCAARDACGCNEREAAERRAGLEGRGHESMRGEAGPRESECMQLSVPLFDLLVVHIKLSVHPTNQCIPHISWLCWEVSTHCGQKRGLSKK
eukprot:1161391-Pelagomonas_calceolata.AAC.9